MFPDETEPPSIYTRLATGLLLQYSLPNPPIVLQNMLLPTTSTVPVPSLLVSQASPLLCRSELACETTSLHFTSLTFDTLLQ